MSLRDLTNVSVHPIANWDARYTSSFCHRSRKKDIFAAFLHSSFCIHGFVMTFLPRIVTTFHSAWNDISGTVVNSFQRCKCFSDSVHCTLIGSKPDTTLTHMFTPSNTCFQERKTLGSRRGLFQLDELHVAHLLNSASWFFTEDDSTNRQIVTNRFLCMIQLLTFPTFRWFHSSLLHLARWHLEMLLLLEGQFRCVAFSQHLAQDLAQVSL